jgi:hypothetical protein
MPEEEKVEIVLSAASPVSLEQAAAWSPAERNLVLRAASKIAEADKAAADKAAADEIAREQHEQSRVGRKERQAAAAAK